MIEAVAETVSAQRAGVLAGGQGHPGRHRDGGHDAAQLAEAANLHQAAKVRELLVAEQQVRHGAIQADHQDFHVNNGLPSRPALAGTPRAAKIVGARSTKWTDSLWNGRFMSST